MAGAVGLDCGVSPRCECGALDTTASHRVETRWAVQAKATSALAPAPPTGWWGSLYIRGLPGVTDSLNFVLSGQRQGQRRRVCAVRLRATGSKHSTDVSQPPSESSTCASACGDLSSDRLAVAAVQNDAVELYLDRNPRWALPGAGCPAKGEGACRSLERACLIVLPVEHHACRRCGRRTREPQRCTHNRKCQQQSQSHSCSPHCRRDRPPGLRVAWRFAAKR